MYSFRIGIRKLGTLKEAQSRKQHEQLYRVVLGIQTKLTAEDAGE
jgi:hypothetical protein